MISFEQLENMKSYEELKRETSSISIKEDSIFRPFYRALEKKLGIDSTFVLFYSPQRREHERLGIYRYIIVEKDGDLILLLLKFVNMFKIRYLRLDMLPISIKGDDSNEREVLKVLLENGLIGRVCFVEWEEEVIKEMGLSKGGVLVSDFYTNIEERYNDRVLNNKWKSKEGINGILKNERVEFRKIEEKDLEKVKKLYNAWEDPGYYCQKFRAGMMEKLLVEDVFAYGLFVDEEPVMVRVYLRTIDDEVMRDEINISYAMCRKEDMNYPEETVELIERLRNRWAAIFSYFITKEFFERGIKFCFEGGAVSEKEKDVSGVWEHKKLHCTGRIIHYKSEYIGGESETDPN